jgi:hypothetical protein
VLELCGFTELLLLVGVRWGDDVLSRDELVEMAATGTVSGLAIDSEWVCVVMVLAKVALGNLRF